MLRSLVSPFLLALLALGGEGSALCWHSRSIQLQGLYLFINVKALWMSVG